MRQQQQQALIRQASTAASSAQLRQAIVQQAQALDSQGQASQFFYQSTIQEATAVTKALRARFTYRIASEDSSQVAPNPQPAEELKTQSQERVLWRLETNLVTFASNVLKVYALTIQNETNTQQMDLRLSTQFNGRILDIIKVPTEPFLREERASGTAEAGGHGRKRKGHGDSNQPTARDMRISRRKQRVMIDTTEGQNEDEEQQVNQEAAKQAEPEEENSPDYLFVILSNFTVALLAYNRREHKIDVVSRGNISEKVLHDQKEAPYPIFLGQSGKFIALMLYHSILKVIPLVLRDDPNNPHICSLTHATAVRICHSNVMQVIPLFQEGSAEQPTFGVVYQRTDHVRIPGVVGPPSLQIKVELEKQIFDIDRRDLTPLDKNGGKLEFVSNNVYRVEPLPFGGFFAFDIDTVSYYRGEHLSNAGAYHEQLKSAHSVSAFCQVDEFDVGKGCTTTGTPFVRFLIATEAGELFMLAMHAETLSSVLGGAALDHGESLLTIEFLAAKLTFCSSLVYLDDSLVFYSSKEGDSYILRICAEHQGSPDQPYVSIEQKFSSLAPIMDLQLARPENVNGQQAELVVVGGWNHQTNMNLVKQGVGLRSLKSFESLLPADMVQSFYSVGNDLVFMQMYGYDRLVGLRVSQKDQQEQLGRNSSNQGDGKGIGISLEGFDAAFHLEIPRNCEILTLQATTLTVAKAKQAKTENQDNNNEAGEQQMAVDQVEKEEEEKEAVTIDALVYATDTAVKVYQLNRDSTSNINLSLIGEQKVAEGSKNTLVKVSGDKLVIARQGGILNQLRLSASKVDDGKITVSIEQVVAVDMGSEVSAMSLSEDSGVVDLIYVTLYDPPFYSLNVLSLHSESTDDQPSLRMLARIPLTSLLELPQTKTFYQHEIVQNGQVFAQFNHQEQSQIDSPSKQRMAPQILADLPGSAALDNIEEVEDNQMEVDQATAGQGVVVSSNETSFPAFKFNCSAGRSLEHLTSKAQQVDTILIGFANGKLLQICLDLAHMAEIKSGDQAPFLDFSAYAAGRLGLVGQPGEGAEKSASHDQDLNLEQSGPFWGAQVSYVATILPKMRKIRMDSSNTEAVIACSDRPVVFYEANDSIEMHYLAYRQIRDIACITTSSAEGQRTQLMLYEDERGVLHLSENDSLRRLQIQRMVFKMQISKTLLVPANDAIVVLLEQPNLDYIDASKQACNAVALVSRATMRTQAVFRLEKREIANCAYSVNAPKSGAGNQDKVKWLLIGTAFLDPEETIPSTGRILMLDAQTMDLIQVFTTSGSVQSILVTEQNKFLLLGVNNQVQAYDFTTFMPSMRANTGTFLKAGKFEMLCSKSSGTFIQSIVKLAAPGSDKRPTDLAESIVVGDMTGRGVATFELKPCRLNQVKLVESASSHISLWVNSIVALSDSQFIVFDHEGNLFIFQKNLYPTCIEEKLKLRLKASYCIGEQVQAAAFGSLRSTLQLEDSADKNLSDEQQIQGAKIKQKKKSYVDAANSGSKQRKQSAGKRSITRQLEGGDQEMADLAGEEENKKEQEQVMIVTRGKIAKQNQKSQEANMVAELTESANFGKILKDVDFARKFAAKTLEELFVIQAQKCSIVYGTTDGSLGSLFQIPPKVYLLLQLLQHEMDSNTYVDLVQQKRSEYRKVRQTPATQTELQSGKSMLNGIIDGDLIEVFLELPKSKKLEYAKGMLGMGGAGARTDEEFTELLTQIVSLMKKTH